MKKIKISAPFFSGIKKIEAAVSTAQELSMEMNAQLGRGIDFSKFTLAVNGKAVGVNDPLPTFSALRVEISESENESGC